MIVSYNIYLYHHYKKKHNSGNLVIFISDCKIKSIAFYNNLQSEELKLLESSTDYNI